MATLEQIKQYNEQIKQYEKKAEQLRYHKKACEDELARLCQELTQELGTPVTVDNIKDIYEARMKKIEDTLATGNEILARIRLEDQRSTNPSQNVNTTQEIPSVQVGGVPPMAPQIPNIDNLMAPTQAQAPTQAPTFESTPW